MKNSKALTLTRKINRFILLVGVLGVLLCAYLWSVQIQPVNPYIPCTPDGGCSEVLKSDLSKIAGVPMSVFGFFFYCSLLLLAFQREFITDKLLDKLLILTTAFGVFFSVYLRYLEFFVLGHICVWCWVSVLFIVLIALALFFEHHIRSGTRLGRKLSSDVD